MTTEESDKDGKQTVAFNWQKDFPDREADDLKPGPERRVDIAGRCASCWGQCLAIVGRDQRYVGLACRVCDQSVDEANVERELERMVTEADSNLPAVRVGQEAKYDENARFVLKLLPDMDRSKPDVDRRIAKAKEGASKNRKAGGKLSRRDFQEAGTPGFLFLQASVLVSGLNALPREISAFSLADIDYERLERNVEVQIDDTGKRFHMASSAPSKQLDSDRLISRMGTAMITGFGAAFACEVAMKAILLTRLDEADKSHDLWELYESLPGDCQERLQGDFPEISNIMKEYSHTFGKWRYFEPDALQNALSILVNLDQIRGLEKAARVLLDEGVVSGLQYGIHGHYDFYCSTTTYFNQDRTVTTVLDEDSWSNKISIQIDGHEAPIAWDDILSLPDLPSEQAGQ